MTDQLRPTVPADHHVLGPQAPVPASLPSTPSGYPAAPAALGDGGWPPYAVSPADRGHRGGAGAGPAAWIVGGAVLLVLLVVGGLATVLLTLGGPSATPAPSPAAAPVGTAAPSAPSVPGGTGGTAASPASGTASDPSLDSVFPASVGSLCAPYSPSPGEYVTSRGSQAVEVRACADGDGGIVFTRWGSAADAEAVVTDQANFPSVDGKTTWTMGGTTQGSWHERQLDDGSCMASLSYTGAPYSVLITAPSCAAVDQMFQDVPLPDVRELPAA